MSLRMNYSQANPAAFKAMLAMEQFAKNSGLDTTLYELIKLRASQINGCSYCIDMHATDLLKLGETTDRLLLLPVWREVPIYSEKEKAVLELTEYVTKISENGVPDDVFNRVKQHFGDKEIVDLIMAINVINCWNRLGVATGMFPGCHD